MDLTLSTNTASKMAWWSPLFAVFFFFFRSSVDYVAPTQDNFPSTPLIVPSSPTEPENEHSKPALMTEFILRAGQLADTAKINLFCQVLMSRWILHCPRKTKRGKRKNQWTRRPFLSPTHLPLLLYPRIPLVLCSSELSPYPPSQSSLMYVF